MPEKHVCTATDAELLSELEALVSEWCRVEEDNYPYVEQPRKKWLTVHESEIVRAGILHVMRQHRGEAADVDTLIEWLIDAGGYWLPTIPDGMAGYLGALQSLRFGLLGGGRLTVDGSANSRTAMWSLAS
jgi:hypothetical protein